MTVATVETIAPGGSLAQVPNARERESQALQILNDRGKDLADLSEAEFEAGLVRLQMVKSRMLRLLDTVLVDGAHYGNPKDDKGRSAFKKPILLQAGAQELRRLMRLSCRRTAPDAVVSTSDFVSVKVTLGVFDQSGRFIVERTGSCNSKEKRFKKYGGNDSWIYEDAREVEHTIAAMAEKRAASLCTLEASGATAFLANGEEMAEDLADDKPITPWTDTEKQSVYDLCAKFSIGRKALGAIVSTALDGRTEIGTGDDVLLIRAAIEAAGAAKAATKATKDAPTPSEEPAQ